MSDLVSKFDELTNGFWRVQESSLRPDVLVKWYDKEKELVEFVLTNREVIKTALDESASWRETLTKERGVHLETIRQKDQYRSRALAAEEKLRNVV